VFLLNEFFILIVVYFVIYSIRKLLDTPSYFSVLIMLYISAVRDSFWVFGGLVSYLSDTANTNKSLQS